MSDIELLISEKSRKKEDKNPPYLNRMMLCKSCRKIHQNLEKILKCPSETDLQKNLAEKSYRVMSCSGNKTIHQHQNDELYVHEIKDREGEGQ